MSVTASTPNNRFRRGLNEYTSLPTAASTMYNVGDLIWSNSGVAAVASAKAWDTNLATTQADFRKLFVGVCMDNKAATDTTVNNILICTRGIYTYPCVALGSGLNVGDLLGPAKDTGNNLLDQVLVDVTSAGLTSAVATLVEEAPTGATSLVCFMQSFLLYTSLAVAS